ncbi:hypothetical protein AAFF_G00352030 [Aldrovandia affinis]|uniref:Uncharacterized protein n=1 Tax=Aldrovandia affinis TaxID=143900 RepID=A0AAD7SL39_9TELE|nr:hypothetical protein AAFF_G00352030 [Aldrovandia affinis]
MSDMHHLDHPPHARPLSVAGQICRLHRDCGNSEYTHPGADANLPAPRNVSFLIYKEPALCLLILYGHVPVPSDRALFILLCLCDALRDRGALWSRGGPSHEMRQCRVGRVGLAVPVVHGCVCSGRASLHRDPEQRSQPRDVCNNTGGGGSGERFSGAQRSQESSASFDFIIDSQ